MCEASSNAPLLHRPIKHATMRVCEAGGAGEAFFYLLRKTKEGRKGKKRNERACDFAPPAPSASQTRMVNGFSALGNGGDALQPSPKNPAPVHQTTPNPTAQNTGGPNERLNLY